MHWVHASAVICVLGAGVVDCAGDQGRPSISSAVVRTPDAGAFDAAARPDVAPVDAYASSEVDVGSEAVAGEPEPDASAEPSSRAIAIADGCVAMHDFTICDRAARYSDDVTPADIAGCRTNCAGRLEHIREWTYAIILDWCAKRFVETGGRERACRFTMTTKGVEEMGHRAAECRKECERIAKSRIAAAAKERATDTKRK